MSDEPKHEFPEWQTLYREKSGEALPWFHPELDPDLARALDELGVQGGSALDIGTGPGTQAVELARRGFRATGTDLSEEALRQARQRAEAQGVEVAWVQDDILQTRLERGFDVVFDRGCFHVLDPERRADYVRIVAGLVKPGGHLFLKCFSRLQPGEYGPYRFTPEQVRQIFGGPFQALSIHETVYQGTLDPLPLALFCVLRRA